jgi:outer membrane usher protein
MSARYSNLSQNVSDDRAHLETNLSAGFQTTARTSVNIQHTFSNPHDQGPTQRISVSSSTRLTDWLNLLLTARHSRAHGTGVTELFASLSFRVGNTNVNVSYQRYGEESSGTVSLQKSLPVGSGFGYRVQASRARAESYQATGVAQYQGPWGRYEARYDRFNEQGRSTLSMAGALVGIGGSIFATRPVLDGFALIQVPGTADVRGYASNQEIGTTDSRGNLLIPTLLPYYGNRIRVSDEDIPIDYRIDETERLVAPPFRGGAVVTFPVQRLQIITGALVIESAGQLTPPSYGGIVVSAAGKTFDSPIGKQGEFYFENVPAGRHEAIIDNEGSVCRFIIEIPVIDAREVKLGTLRCTAQ